MLSPALARVIGVGNDTTLLLRLGGNESLVRAAVDAAGALGTWREVPVEVWNTLRNTLNELHTTFRVSALPSLAGDLWSRVQGMTEGAGGYAAATLSRGVIRCALPALDDSPFSRASSGELQLPGDYNLIVERASDALWRSVDSDRTARALETRVRRTFDPDNILNPGILDV